MDTGEKHIKQAISIFKVTQWKKFPFCLRGKYIMVSCGMDLFDLLLNKWSQSLTFHVKGKHLYWKCWGLGAHTEAASLTVQPLARQAVGKCFLHKWLQIENETRISKLLGFETSLFLYSICTFHKHISSLFLNIQKPDAQIMPRNLLPAPSPKNMLTEKLAVSY